MSKVDEDNQKTIDRLSQDIAYDIMKECKDIIREEDRVYTEDLVNGFQYDPDKKLLFNTKIYARITEFGFPRGIDIPVGRLRQWISDKLSPRTTRDTYALTMWFKKKIRDEGIAPIFYMYRAIGRIANK